MDKHVFESASDENGSHRYSAVRLDDAGQLVIETHDLGPVVERFFGEGNTEYEALETFTAQQTQFAKISLGDDVIAAIAVRFTSSGDLKAYLTELGVGAGDIWNRIGS